jgi:L-threonylcarbamoyladenylate synthase
MANEMATKIAASLNAGGVALAPTDTVYGLIAKPDFPAAKNQIFVLKDRPQQLNLQVLLPAYSNPTAIGADISAAESLLDQADIRARITFILPLDADNKPAWLSDRAEVGVRIPDDDRIQAVLALTGPLFATSANLHGRTPGIACSTILADLKGVPAAVWDVGELGGTASTVVNFNAEPPKVLRWGVIDDLTRFGLGHA